MNKFDDYLSPFAIDVTAHLVGALVFPAVFPSLGVAALAGAACTTTKLLIDWLVSSGSSSFGLSALVSIGVVAYTLNQMYMIPIMSYLVAMLSGTVIVSAGMFLAICLFMIASQFIGAMISGYVMSNANPSQNERLNCRM